MLTVTVFAFLVCDIHSKMSGYIDSPNYPAKYPHNEVCPNLIKNYYGNRITLEMEHFDLERSENCTKDSLKIYDSMMSESTLMSTRCGNDTRQYVSTSNLTSLLFTTDKEISRTGYRIHYKGMFVCKFRYKIHALWFSLLYIVERLLRRIEPTFDYERPIFTK